MKLAIITLTYFSILASTVVKLNAQDFFAAERAGWLKTAEQTKPRLIETIKKPVGIVTITKDLSAFQGWSIQAGKPIDSLFTNSFKKQSGVIVDFGEHLTGYFRFSLKALRGVSDAPLRLKFTFGEVPAELVTSFDPYPGSLSRAWLQDELVTVMEVPAQVTIERRVSFRYLKIELLGSSPYFDFGFADMEFKAVTSVNSMPSDLATGTDPLVIEIDKVGRATLKECMQTVFEDGPKRDRRLWIGDLYLQALANAYSFQNHQLTKRCLYLIAGLSGQNGYLNSNAFETPEPHAQTGAPFLFEYSLLYNATLKDYLAFSGDKETALALWPVAKKQLESPKKYLLPNGLFDSEAAAKAGWWLFVDWNNQLDKQAPIQGIILYCLKQTYELAVQLGKQDEVSDLPPLIKKMSDAAKKNLLDKQKGVFVSGPSKQVSYASQAWMILGGVVSKMEAKKIIQQLWQVKEAVRPGTPYLQHYYMEALLQSGMEDEAKKTLLNYWGGMVKKGADTFWEVYDPANEQLSPYNFYPVNSYCHAWSCTPVYFIRKYAEVFQK